MTEDRTLNTEPDKDMNKPEETHVDFIRQIVAQDVAEGKNDGRVHTRWPPEPNGYIHIGHAKGFLLAYGIAQDFNGKFNPVSYTHLTLPTNREV